MRFRQSFTRKRVSIGYLIVFCTAMINYIYRMLSVVQIYDIHISVAVKSVFAIFTMTKRDSNMKFT